LAGVSFLAVGVFTSALTDNQIIAGLFSFGILLFFWLVDWMAQAVGGKTGELLGSLSLIKHYEDFNKGIIDTSHIIFYLTMTAVFLFLTIRQLESRRWK
jgi:ABC-2 type transport system permease protein